MSFDQEKYWIERHRTHIGDPRSVGTFARSVEDNFEGERQLQLIVSEVARRLRPAKTVADLGCGYGRIAGQFIELGYDYTGVDISPDAIEAAKKRHPTANFVCSTLNAWDPNERFDLVCVLYVFVHFVDQAAWLSFLNAGLGLVKEGGALVFADEFPEQEQAYGAHVLCRPMSAYLPILAANGFVQDSSFAASLLEATGQNSAKHFRLFRKQRVR